MRGRGMIGSLSASWMQRHSRKQHLLCVSSIHASEIASWLATASSRHISSRLVTCKGGWGTQQRVSSSE